jgi:alpha 1,2-mannosyltransferase
MKDVIENSCIFYLVNNNPIHLRRLQSSLQCLQSNFLNEYPYPIVFGYDDLSNEIKNNITQNLTAKHYFHKINFTIPDYPEEIKAQIPEFFKGHWDENAYFSIGYRHMCRYFAGEILKDPFFEKVNYLLRLDCDSYITDKLTFDIFQFVKDKKIKYATVGEKENELDYVIIGLKEFLHDFFKKDYKLPSINKTFDTHFELIDYKWFKDSPYLEFYNTIDDTGRIYTNRWGDAPIKYQGVNYFLDKNEIYIFDLPYKHGGDL